MISNFYIDTYIVYNLFLLSLAYKAKNLLYILVMNLKTSFSYS